MVNNRVFISSRFAAAAAFLIFLSLFAAGGASGVEFENPAPDKLPPRELLSRGGFAVLVGGADGITAAREMLNEGPWVIHWIDGRRRKVANRRALLHGRGLYGPVSVEHWDTESLPYGDNLVNLMIVFEKDQLKAGKDEVLRVLSPGGAVFGAFTGTGGEPLAKRRPEGMGEWTHPWNRADGNLAASDSFFGAPNAFQWIAGPNFNLGHRAWATTVILSAGGRHFSVTQDAAENIDTKGSLTRRGPWGYVDRAPFYLVARDAFSGVLLWSKKWDGPHGLRRDGAPDPHEAIVATAERIYTVRDAKTGHDESSRMEIAVLDAATGQVRETWPIKAGGGEMSEHPAYDESSKLLLEDGILVAQSTLGLYGFDTGSGTQLWHHRVENPWGALLSQGSVLFFHSSREADGRWRHELEALDLEGGGVRWRETLESDYVNPNRPEPVIRLFFGADGIAGLVERNVFRALSIEDGSELWRREVRAEARGRGTWDSRQIGHFSTGGAVWLKNSPPRGGREAPANWLVLDPHNGEILREVDVEGKVEVAVNIHKQGCQRRTATERYVIQSRVSIAWDQMTGKRSIFKFARGGCMIGMIPANGLGYVPPNSCGCLFDQFGGTLALVRTRDPGLSEILQGKLEKGPAYDDVRAGLSPGSEPPAWPMYRGQGSRGAFSSRKAPEELEQVWRTGVSAMPDWRESDIEWRLRPGKRLTPPVAGAGLVLLAEPQTHRVTALCESTGEKKWRFTAGGRIVTPPAIYGGIALLGANDGFVYALNLSNGELAWRRRVAPSKRRIIAYGQLESAWPVKGGVLVHGDAAIAAAGRAADADGGIVVTAMEPLTGELLWSRRVSDAEYGLADLLVSDTENVYLMDNKLDPETGEVFRLKFAYGQSERQGAKVEYPDGISYLRGGKRGFLEFSWTRPRLVIWPLRKAHSTWSLTKDIEGELIAFNSEKAFAFQYAGIRANAPRNHGGGTVKAWRRADDGPGEEIWSYKIKRPAQAEAMLAGGGQVFAAGPGDRTEPYGPGFLFAFCGDTGTPRKAVFLDTAPVHDGMAASDGSIFVVFRDGTIGCFGSE